MMFWHVLLTVTREQLDAGLGVDARVKLSGLELCL